MLSASSSAHQTEKSIDFEQAIKVSGKVKEFFGPARIALSTNWCLMATGGSPNGCLIWSHQVDCLAPAGYRQWWLLGDDVTVTRHPLKKGTPQRKALAVELPDATVMGETSKS